MGELRLREAMANGNGNGESTSAHQFSGTAPDMLLSAGVSAVSGGRPAEPSRPSLAVMHICRRSSRFSSTTFDRRASNSSSARYTRAVAPFLYVW